MQGSTTSSRGRKHDSLQDIKIDAQPPAEIIRDNPWTGKQRCSGSDGSHQHNWSEIGAHNASKSNDSSGLSSWGLFPRRRDIEKSDNFGKEADEISHAMKRSSRDDRHSRSIASFDGRSQQHTRHSPENSRGLSHRVRGRCRSRSRSRSRGRGKSRSRSRVRGRERSRSPSRSPFLDQKRDSYGWNDRRSGLGVSSQQCREFAVGNCRRGSQCRFLHQDVSHNGRDHAESNPTDRWRSRSDRGNVSEISNNISSGELLKDKSYRHASGYGDHEPLRNDRKVPICNDFVKGRCHRGVSCRFGHTDASGDNHERGNRAASFDNDDRHQTNRNTKPPCKFFAMGRCHRDDCRFSHDVPIPESLEKGSLDDLWAHRADEKSKSWKGPTWDDVTSISNITSSAGYGDNSVVNMNLADQVKAETQTVDRWGHALENSGRTCASLSLKDKVTEGNNYRSSHWGAGGNGANTGAIELIMEEVNDKEVPQSKTQNLQSQILTEIPLHIDEQNGKQDTANYQLSPTVPSPKVSEDLYIQPHHRQGEHIFATAGGPIAVNGANPRHLAFATGQRLNQNDNMGSQPPNFSGTDQNQDLLIPDSPVGHNMNLNGSVQHILSSLNPENLVHVHREGGITSETMEKKAKLAASTSSHNALTSGQFAQMANLAVSMTLMPGSGLISQLNVLPKTLGPPGLVLSLPNPAMAGSPKDALDVQPNPAARTLQQYDPTKVGMEPSEPSNGKIPGILSESAEQRKQMRLEQLPPPSTNDTSSIRLQKSGASVEENHIDMLPLKKPELVADPQINGNVGVINEKCKQQEENPHSGNMDADANFEDGNGNKDEKTMRLFKVALVEFVKEILKPTWKEGQMSREVHKTIVKKVVDKVTGTIQENHVPKTQDKINQYLSFSRPKISKLVKAYVDRLPKK